MFYQVHQTIYHLLFLQITAAYVVFNFSSGGGRAVFGVVVLTTGTPGE